MAQVICAVVVPMFCALGESGNVQDGLVRTMLCVLLQVFAEVTVTV